MKKIKKNLFSLSLVFSMVLGIAFSFVPQDVDAKIMEDSCTAGGPGSTSCSLTVTIMVLGNETTTTTSTSCGSGYYACCSWGSATCKKMLSTISYLKSNLYGSTYKFITK